jgi:hypothetical protein
VLLGNIGPQVSPGASDRYADVEWANRLFGELHSHLGRVVFLRMVFWASTWGSWLMVRWQCVIA